MGTNTPRPLGSELPERTIQSTILKDALKPGDPGYEEPTGEPVIEGSNFDSTRAAILTTIPTSLDKNNPEDPPKL